MPPALIKQMISWTISAAMGTPSPNGLYDQVVLTFESLYVDAKGEENDPVHLATAQLALEF
ncbi:MAG: hypothetical protein JRE63_12860 [Deltaproteobacteria bacterium]|nr:hypothetical protein [Deltaproteobacteria bacterium]